MRLLLIPVAALTVLLAACWHRSAHALRIGQEVEMPRGLDSAGVANWVAQQRASCPGILVIEQGGLAVVSLDGSPVPYYSPIIGIRCERP
jgi:hypothetical protein